MNALIRNVENAKNMGELVGILSAYVKGGVLDKVPKDERVVMSPKKYNLSQSYVVTKQGNGNLLIEVGEE